MVLDKIKKANDIKKLSPQEVDILRDEIREFLIDSISVTWRSSCFKLRSC